MKKIEAIIRPLKLDEVKIALGEIGVTGMSVSDVRGTGSNPASGTRVSGAGVALTITTAMPVHMPIRSRIEVVARDEDVDEIVSIIERYARTGEAGDGKIFVLPMMEAIRVRTEEKGDTVL